MCSFTSFYFLFFFLSVSHSLSHFFRHFSTFYLTFTRVLRYIEKNSFLSFVNYLNIIKLFPSSEGIVELGRERRLFDKCVMTFFTRNLGIISVILEGFLWFLIKELKFKFSKVFKLIFDQNYKRIMNVFLNISQIFTTISIPNKGNGNV